jgi:hypothetical protein
VRSFSIILVAAVAAGAVAAVAWGSASRIIARASASGDFATVVASGHAQGPHGFFVRVLARPRQRLTVDWTVICSKRTGAGAGAGSKSGRFDARAPVRRSLRLPMRAPDYCAASVGGSLDSSGTVTVILESR